jgi:hypothetical protein
MRSPPRQPTPLLEQRIAQYIRGGCYPHVAAEARGVPRAVFTAWMERGSRPGARLPYRSFYREIRRARAEARAAAEIAAWRDDPLFWLRSGPGRETAASPGWSGQVKPADRSAATGEPQPGSLAWNELWQRLLAVLDQFPEARTALANALRQWEVTAAQVDVRPSAGNPVD